MKQWLDRVVHGRWSRPAFAAVAVVGAATAFSPSAAWRVITQVGQFLAAHPVTVVLLVAAVVALVDHGRRIGRRKPVPGRWPWLLSDRGIFVVVGLMACGGAAVMTVMLVLAHTADGVERTKLQLDAIKYGLGVMAAAGAAAALLLSVRRQRHTEEDAEEQRMTDIYTAAVEQLGHAEAPVRLGGMYALERLAQANPSQRQTVVNVLCAYLRMPFIPPADMNRFEVDTEEGAVDVQTSQGMRDPKQELQVRLTAQRILTQHLRRPKGVSTIGEAEEVHPSAKQRFWPNIDLELTGAFLGDFDFGNCHARNASIRDASFGGNSTFVGATFGGHSWFNGASFDGGAWFDGVSFGGGAGFGGVSFRNDVGFGGVSFGRGAWFGGTSFAGDVWFDKSSFEGYTGFGGVSFGGDAGFNGVSFDGDVWFDDATFGGDADFDEAAFGGDAGFGGVSFGGDVSFLESKAAANQKHELPTGFTTQESGDPGWLNIVQAQDDSSS